MSGIMEGVFFYNQMYFIKHWVLDYIILTITLVGKIRLMIKTKVRERERERVCSIFFFFLSKRERISFFSFCTSRQAGLRSFTLSISIKSFMCWTYETHVSLTCGSHASLYVSEICVSYIQRSCAGNTFSSIPYFDQTKCCVFTVSTKMLREWNPTILPLSSSRETNVCTLSVKSSRIDQWLKNPKPSLFAFLAIKANDELKTPS